MLDHLGDSRLQGARRAHARFVVIGHGQERTHLRLGLGPLFARLGHAGQREGGQAYLGLGGRLQARAEAGELDGRQCSRGRRHSFPGATQAFRRRARRTRDGLLVAVERGARRAGEFVHLTEGQQAVEGQSGAAGATEPGQGLGRAICGQAQVNQALRGIGGDRLAQGHAQGAGLLQSGRCGLGGHVVAQIRQRADAVAGGRAQRGAREAGFLDVELDRAIDPRSGQRRGLPRAQRAHLHGQLPK